MADKQVLPKKENGLFKDLIDCHDSKQYKKGLKNADAILAKFPNHGQTLAMKGLILNCLDRKTEAYELVKLGVKNDIRSHIPWHVLGLLHRSDKQYKEAIKCYKTAVRMDEGNQSILRDLSWMQVQVLDFPGFCESRRQILLQKPTLKQNWIVFAVSHYLTENYTEALAVLKEFFTSNVEDRSDYETSEFLLFQNQCISKTGDYDKAMEHLYTHESQICDKNSLRTKAAEYLTYQKRFAESLDMWLSLIKDQPENYRYHAGAQVAALRMDVEQAKEMFALKRLELPCTALTLSEEQRQTVAALYGIGAAEGTVPSIKSSRASRKIELSLQPTQEAFKEALDKHLRKMLDDGLPSLCNDICALVMQPDPVHSDRNIYVKDLVDFGENAVCVTTLELVDGYIANLRENGTFFPTSAETPPRDSSSDAPTCLLWALFLRCHIYEMCGRYAEALVDAEACVAHTPTALDMQLKKARIIKRLGDVNTASAVVDQCRSLDLQDRYLNNKATKYFLRANKVDNALETISMFTKEEPEYGDSQQVIFRMQSSWYELECGEAYERLGKKGPALKKFYAIESHFIEYTEDVFDVHGYSLRKGTLAAYLNLPVFLDTCYGHKYMQRAARGVLRIYANILSAASSKESDDAAAGDAEMTAAEKQKAKLKARKQKKKEGSTAEAAPSESDNKNSGGKAGTNKDDDPLGDKILQLDAATEALRWCAYVSKNPKSDAETQECASIIYLLTGKTKLALKAISDGLAIAPNHPGLALCLVKAARLVEGVSVNGISTTQTVDDEVRETLSRLMNGLDSTDFVSRFCGLPASATSLPHCLSAARMTLLSAGAAGSATAAQFITNVSGASLSCLTGNGASAKNVQAVHEFLEKELKNNDAAELFKRESLKVFPYMNYFGCNVQFSGIFAEDEEKESS